MYQTLFPNLLHKTLDTRREHSHCANINIKASKIKVHFDGIFVRKVKIVSVNASFACFKNRMYGSIEANGFNVCSLIIEHTNKERKEKKQIIFESLTSINKIIHILYNIYLLFALHAIPLHFSVRHVKCMQRWMACRWITFLHNTYNCYTFVYSCAQNIKKNRSQYS